MTDLLLLHRDRDSAAFRSRRPKVTAIAATALLCAFLAIGTRHFGTDLRVYREAVSAWSKRINPYSVTYTNGLQFTYPPFALLALWPLGLLSFQTTQWLLGLSTLAACAISTRLVFKVKGYQLRCPWWSSIAWASLALLILEPARSGFTFGQIEALLMLAVLADALIIPAPYRGIVIGVVSAIKLTPLIFVLFLLLRDLRSSIRAGAAFVAVTSIAWLWWPQESRSFWLHDVFKPGRVGGVSYAGNQSWFGVLHRSPFPHTGSMVLWITVCVVTLGSGMYIAWRSVRLGSSVQGLMAIALTGLLISPISWTHHWVWIVLIPPVLVTDRRTLHPRVRAMLWVLVALAVLAPYWWFTSGLVADFLDDSLALWGFASLVCWAVTLGLSDKEYRLSTGRPGGRLDIWSVTEQ